MSRSGRDRRIGEAIDALYEAAAAPEAWTDALDKLDALFGAHSAHFFLWDETAGRRLTSQRSRSFADNHPDWDYFHKINPRRAILSKLAPATPMNCADHISDGMVSRSEFFVDYSLPAGRRYLLGSNVIRDGSTTASFAVIRGPDQLAFDAQSTHQLLELMPHLVRAAKIQKRMLCTPRDCADALSQAALDQLGDGVLITDGAGRIVRLNRAAEQMLVRNGVMSVRQRRLRLTTDHATSQLRALIADAASHAVSGQSGGTLLVEADGLRWVFLVAPLMPRVAIFDLQDQRLALIIVTRLTLPATLERRLRQAFLLTRAEARLAAQLMGGATLDGISEQLGVRLPTLRTQLKTIFRKTDTNRQGELMRLGMLFKPLHDPHDDGV